MGYLVRVALALALGAGSTFTIVARPADAKLAASCDVYVFQTFPMPDGKTYAIALRSKTGSPADIRLSLSSDPYEYRLDLKNVTFEPAATKAPSSFAAPLFFVALPRIDRLLGLVAAPQGLENCLATLSYTDAYRLSDDPKYRPSTGLDADREELTRVFLSGVAPDKAIEVSAAADGPGDCPVRYRTPGAVKLFQPEYPLAARQKRIGGVVLVKIELDVDDSIVQASIFRSSGHPDLDAEALKAALRSEYKAAIFRCRPMPGTYLFRANFSPS